jgi:hypothetical protein
VVPRPRQGEKRSRDSSVKILEHAAKLIKRLIDGVAASGYNMMVAGENKMRGGVDGVFI